MGAELHFQLGDRAHQTPPAPQTNHRDRHSRRTVLTDDVSVSIAVSRDCDSPFERLLISKFSRHDKDVDSKIIAMSVHVMPARQSISTQPPAHRETLPPDMLNG